GRPGFLHGGAISGLLEMAAIVALRHALAEEGGGRIKPVNVTVDFMRGGRDKPTRAAGIVTRLGGRVANVEAAAWQDDRDRPIASARMNYLLVRLSG
ncbi:PaaI family thioesterase, partial [uncultured Sphingomonas sp.]|uniref:PaaI family thioesterase n=1 Tax=uncultured Sphingomonas sp. TaxID=158754 RepID=UPI0035C9DE8D